MIYDVVVGKEKLAEVAKRYGRSHGYISNVVKKLRKNKELLREHIEKREQFVLKESMVREVIKDLIASEAFISSSQMVVDEVQA